MGRPTSPTVSKSPRHLNVQISSVQAHADSISKLELDGEVVAVGIRSVLGLCDRIFDRSFVLILTLFPVVLLFV
jgi:hypothetical protein